MTYPVACSFCGAPAEQRLDPGKCGVLARCGKCGGTESVAADATIADVLEGRARWCVVEGDCLEVLPTIERVDHVITDPPYGPRVHANLGKEGRSDGMSIRDALEFPPLTQKQAASLGKEFARSVVRWVVAFGDEFTMGYWMACGLPWVRAGAWVKPDGMPQMSGDRPANGYDTISIMHAPRPPKSGRMRWNGGGRAAVWTVPVERGAERLHATPKPRALMQALVADFTDPDDLILDPFCGSGTTGVAALRLGRRFIGIEREPKWVALSRDRLRAEQQNSTLTAARAGQLPLLAGGER